MSIEDSTKNTITQMTSVKLKNKNLNLRSFTIKMSDKSTKAPKHCITPHNRIANKHQHRPHKTTNRQTEPVTMGIYQHDGQVNPISNDQYE